MYMLNVPVALIFFNRPDTFKRVFDEVRKAKPTKLFLIQDGARDGNESDKEKILECRKIVENIDWNCEVHKNYSNVNLGCGKRPATGISWVFEHVDRAIILEDDCVPCKTFFGYCSEMLERYKDDERISYVSGLNHFGEWDCGKYSYFFAKTGAIWGWATWKRAWDRYDYYVSAINDPYLCRIAAQQVTDREVSKARISTWKHANTTAQSGEKLSYWDVQWGFVKYSQNQLVVVPKYNQICNIGVGEQSTHAQSVQTKKRQGFFFIPVRELELTLVHPPVCMCDQEYDTKVYNSTHGNIVVYKAKKMIKSLLNRK